MPKASYNIGACQDKTRFNMHVSQKLQMWFCCKGLYMVTDSVPCELQGLYYMYPNTYQRYYWLTVSIN